MNKEKISARIREIIDKNSTGNISRFAKAANLDIRTVHRYATGESTPTGEALIKIAKTAHVSTDWILTGGLFGTNANEDGNEHRRPYGEHPIDVDALKTCIKMLDEHLTKKGKTLNLDAKAQLIALLYEELLEQEKKEIREDRLNRYIDLAAA